MDIKEIALRIGEKADEYANAKLQSKGEFHPDWHTVRDEYFAEALIAELAKQNEPVAINEPNYHYEAMGCGLEDRGITDRYEAMEYGWNCAIERMFEQLPKDQLFTFPPTAEQIANETAEACAKYIDSTNGNIRGVNTVFSKALRSGTWKEFKKS